MGNQKKANKNDEPAGERKKQTDLPTLHKTSQPRIYFSALERLALSTKSGVIDSFALL